MGYQYIYFLSFPFYLWVKSIAATANIHGQRYVCKKNYLEGSFGIILYARHGHFGKLLP